MAVYLMMGLKEDGFDVHAVSLYPPTHTSLENTVEQAGIPVTYLGKHLGHDMCAYGRVDRSIRDIRPHIVHTHLHTLHYVAPSLLARHVPAAVHTMHFLVEWEAPLIAAINFGIFRLGITPVAIAEEVRRSICQGYRLHNVPLIPNGIPVMTYLHPPVAREECRADLGFDEQDSVFVCVAGLRAEKNHSLLIQAFGWGLASNARAHMLFVGDGELRNDLEGQVKDLGLQGQVHFLGWRADVPAILNAADAFVLASHYEGNPLCIMEAMAAGLPVISTAVGGVPELVEDGVSGVLVTPGDAAAFANAMDTLIAQPALREAMGRYSQQQALEKFDVRKMVDAYEALYDALLLKRGYTKNLSVNC